MITKPRWQKVLSDLWGNRVRSLLVVASIAVGLFAIGIIVSIYAVIAGDMRQGYIAVNPANIYIEADYLDQDMVEHLRRVEGVDDAVGVRSLDLRVRDRDSEWKPLHLQAVRDWAAMPFNRPTLKQGVWPPGRGEIVLDQNKIKEIGAAPGDPVRIELPDGKTRELTLTGVVQDLTIGAYGGGGGFFEAPAWGFVSQETLADLDFSTPYDYNGLYAAISGSRGDLGDARVVSERLTNQMKDSGVGVVSSKATSAFDHPNAYLVNAIIGVLLLLGFLVVFLSGFLITNTLQALLGQQVQQIGIMKSVGARWMQVAGVYMMLIFIFGLLALAVSIPTAAQVSFLILDFLAGMLNFVLLSQHLVPIAVIIQVVLALIMPQAAAWLPIWKGTRISVQEALSGVQSESKVDDKTHSARSAKSARLVSRLFSRPLLISLRNTFRRKGRLALTLLTLTLGGAIFIATFNVQVSLNKVIDRIAQYFQCDVNVSFPQPYRTNKMTMLLDDVPGVGYVEPWATARSELIQADGSPGEKVDLIGPPLGSKLVEPIIIEGRWIEAGDTNAIALGELFQSQYPDLEVGDTLTLRVNGEEEDWVVVGFFRFAGKNGGYSAYTSYDYLSELTGMSNRAVAFQVLGETTPLTPAEQDRLAQAIEARLVAEGIQVGDITTGTRVNEIIGSGFNVLITFMLFLAVLTALVGSIGLAGTMSMNVMERTREIGVMRAIGASNRILMQMVLTEGLIIGGISYLLGALLAFPISKIMSDGINIAVFDAPTAFGFTPIGFLIWLLVVVVLSFAASVIPARNASRLTIREVLAYE